MAAAIPKVIPKVFRKVMLNRAEALMHRASGIPRSGLIWYAPLSNGMLDIIGLSAAALWAALPTTHRSIYLVDENTLRSAETIITNIEESEYLNDGGELVGTEERGYAQYEDGTSEAVLRKAYRSLGVAYPEGVTLSDGTFYQTSPLSITVDNTSNASSLTDFQVDVTIPYQSGMNTDFSDIRFAASNGTTVLGSWLNSKIDSTSASFVVNVPTIPGSSTTKIYCYYGRSDIQLASNGFTTFDNFDGFEKIFPNAASPLTIPTYESSGQAVHPSVVFFRSGWSGYKYWMAMTPYPNGDDDYENPSIVASNDGITWVVPDGLSNPIVPMPVCDHNCDCHLIYNQQTDELWIYYLAQYRSAYCGSYSGSPFYNKDILRLLKSSNGISWDAPVDCMTWDMAVEFYVSPSVSIINGVFYMWVVDTVSRNTYRFDSLDGVTFSNKTICTNLTVSDLWHVSVTFVESLGVYIGSWNRSVSDNLYIFKSTDGLAWERCSQSFNQVFLFNRAAWDNTIYRTCLIYDEYIGKFKCWYSAYSAANAFYTGYSEGDATPILESSQITWSPLTFANVTQSPDYALRGSYACKVVQGSSGGHVKVTLPINIQNNFILEFDYYDDLDSSALGLVKVYESTSKIGVGVYTGSSATHYCFQEKSLAYTAGSVARTVGWHKFGIKVLSTGSAQFYVDGTLIGTKESQLTSCTTFAIEGSTSLPCTFYIDSVRIRKITSVEPVCTVD